MQRQLGEQVDVLSKETHPETVNFLGRKLHILHLANKHLNSSEQT